MQNDEFEDFGNEESASPLRSVRPTRRDHRSRRIDVMKELESGVVDERPTKMRFTRECRKAKIKRVKDPTENIGEENCVEGLVMEVHRRTCEVRLDATTGPFSNSTPVSDSAPSQPENLSSLVCHGHFVSDSCDLPMRERAPACHCELQGEAIEAGPTCISHLPKESVCTKEYSSKCCPISSHIVTAMYRATTSKTLGEFPAVGDRVLLGQVNDAEDCGDGVGSQKYCVVRVLPRKSELKRPGPRDSFYKEQTLAANIDQVVIVASVTQPEFNYGFMDRFLLAANLNDLPFVLVLTKMDLLPNGYGDLNGDIRDFMSIVDKVIPVSVRTGEGIAELRSELDGKSSVFSGQSGVGKSSLINALVPEAGLETGEVRERDGKGRHTTTSSSLFDLPLEDFPRGGIVIDTPGIRSIGLMDMDAETLAKIFPGFFEGDLFTCKYSNCIHVKEQGCAVRAAVDSGKLSRARYASYLRILNSKN